MNKKMKSLNIQKMMEKIKLNKLASEYIDTFKLNFNDGSFRLLTNRQFNKTYNTPVIDEIFAQTLLMNDINSFEATVDFKKLKRNVMNIHKKIMK